MTLSIVANFIFILSNSIARFLSTKNQIKVIFTTIEVPSR